MDWTKLLPTIGTFLGGPAGAIAGEGVAWLAGKLGASEKTVEGVKKVLSGMTPEQLIETKKLDIEFQEFCMTNDIKWAQLDADNVKDARAMQVAALSQDDVFSKRFVYYFITGWSVFSMLYFTVTTFAPVPDANMHNVNTVTGFLIGTALAGCFGYLLGTTARSQKKDEQINQLIQGGQK